MPVQTNEEKKQPGGKSYKLLTLLLLLFLLFLSYYMNPGPWQKIFALLLSGDLTNIIDYIRSFGPYAMLISFLMIVLINIVAVLPNIFFLAANGILFGIIPGTILSWLAESTGVIISFALMRYFGRDCTTALIKRNNLLTKVDEYSGKNGFKIMIIARSIPFVPSGIITALGAVSEIRKRDYIFATLLGKLPSAFIEVSIGHDLASYHEHSMRLTILVLVALSAYGIHLWHKKKTASALQTARIDACCQEDTSKNQ